MGEWLPIETAPKDATEILAINHGADGANISVTCFDGHDWHCLAFFGTEPLICKWNPTFWMPLPAPPKQD